MRITDITPQKRNKNFYNIFIDGEFYCSLDDESIFTLKLKVGTEADTELLNKASEQSAYKKALNYSLSVLSRYNKSKQELIRKLKEKEYDSDTIAAVIDKLTDLGYIDDEKYVEAYIRSKKGSNQAINKKTLLNKLMQKGIDRETIEICLNNEEIDEYEIALSAAEKKLSSLKGSPREKKAKLYAYLYSKGFEYETCSRIINKIEILE